MGATSYHALSQTWARMYRLAHLVSIAAWDSAAMMPPKGSEARAASIAEMQVLLHRMSNRAAGFMPPLSTFMVDKEAVAMLREWIEKMPARKDD